MTDPRGVEAAQGAGADRGRDPESGRREALRAAAPFVLRLPRRSLRGPLGERTGSRPGASIEFEDHRAYQPGDDPRHVDWRAYARTDSLTVRVYREEIAPALDLIVDTSASMAVHPRKAEAARALVTAVRDWAERAGARPRTFVAGGGPLEGEPLFEDRGSAGLLPRSRLRPDGLRVVVSDFLFPDLDPAAAVRRVAAGAAHTWLLQLLDPEELEPVPGRAVTLVDVETGARHDVQLDEPTIAAYRRRLDRLCSSVAAAARALGAGTWARVTAAEPAVMFTDDLLRQGVLEPA